MSIIDGLTLVEKFISQEDEKHLLQAVDANTWRNDLRRRVQHYGYIYDYRERKVDESMYLGALPSWVRPLAQQLFGAKYINALPDQMIVNEYIPGQGITPHVDCVPCFDDTILSLTLGSGCVMQLNHLHSDTTHNIYLHACSLLVLKDEARYAWKHGIPPRKSDLYDGLRIVRGRRVSLTFRRVRLDHTA